MESLKRRVISISLIMTLIITLGAMNSKTYAASKIQTVSSLKDAKYATMDRAPRISFDRKQKDGLVVYLTDNGLPTDIKIYKVSEKGETLIKTTFKNVEDKNITAGTKVMTQLSMKQLFGTSNPKADELTKIKIVARDSSKSTTDLSLNNFITATYIIKNEEKTHEDSAGKKYSTYFSINMAARWSLVKLDEKKDDSLSNYVFRIIDNNSIDGITVIDRNNNNNVVLDRAFYNARKTVDIPLSDIISNLKINDSKYFRVNLMINSEGTIRVEDTTFRFSNVKVKEETKTDTDKKEETKTDTDKKEETKTDTDKKEETKTDTDKKEEAKKQAIKIALPQGIDAKNLVYGDTGTISVAYENVDQDKQNVKWNAVYKDSGKSVSSGEFGLNEKGVYAIGKVDKEKTIVISATLQSNNDVKAETEITVKPVEVNLEDQTMNLGDSVILKDKVTINNINSDRLKNNIKYKVKTANKDNRIQLSDDSKVEYLPQPGAEYSSKQAEEQVTLTLYDDANKTTVAEKTINVIGKSVTMNAKYTGESLVYGKEIPLNVETIQTEFTNVNDEIKNNIVYYYDISDENTMKYVKRTDSGIKAYNGVEKTTDIKVNVMALYNLRTVAEQQVTIKMEPVYKFSMDRAPRSVAKLNNGIIEITVSDKGKNVHVAIQRDFGTDYGKRKYKTISSKDYDDYGIIMKNNDNPKSENVTIQIKASDYFKAFKNHYNDKNYYSTYVKPDKNEKTMRLRIVATDNGGLKSYSVIKFKMLSNSQVDYLVDTPQISYNTLTTDSKNLTMLMNAGKGTTSELKSQFEKSGKMGFVSITDLNANKDLFTQAEGKDLTTTGSLNITKAKLSDGMWKLKVYVTNGSAARVEEIKIKQPEAQGVKVTGVLEEVKEDKVTGVLEEVKE